MDPFQIGDGIADPQLERYQEELNALMAAALAAQIKEDEFRRRLRDIIAAALLLMFLLAGGNRRSPGAQEAIRQMTRQAERSANELTADIFRRGRYGERDVTAKGGAQTAEEGAAKLENRIAKWVAVLAAAYSLGQLHVYDQDKKYMWQLGRTEKHCMDCLRLHGQVHTAADWLASGWQPRIRRLACGGWWCDCNLLLVDPTIPDVGSF